MMEIVKRIAIPLVLSLIVGGLITYFQSLKSIPVAALMFAALFSVFANLMFIIRTLKWNAIKWGGSTAHIGFALMVVGIILSSYNKEVISVNLNMNQNSFFELLL